MFMCGGEKEREKEKERGVQLESFVPPGMC